MRRMNILYRIKRKANSIVDDFYFKRQGNHLKREIENNHSKAIYLFSTPTHSNLGDQAQLYCWHLYFKEQYPSYRVFDVPFKMRDEALLSLVKSKVTENDLLFIHSGYLIYDPHPELPFICEIVDMFHENEITILPQTINLKTKQVSDRVTQCFNSHPRLRLICRDNVSYKLAESLFHNCQLSLMPDVVTSLIGRDFCNIQDGERAGVLFCLRNDGEKFYSSAELNALEKSFENLKTDTLDTTINVSKRSWITHRREYIAEEIERFSQYKVIVTDRYHGTIFSLVANTPVVVISSADHKLSSGVEWFPKEYFSDSIFYAKDLSEVTNLVNKIIDSPVAIQNPAYFKNKYYSNKIS